MKRISLVGWWRSTWLVMVDHGSKLALGKPKNKELFLTEKTTGLAVCRRSNTESHPNIVPKLQLHTRKNALR